MHQIMECFFQHLDRYFLALFGTILHYLGTMWHYLALFRTMLHQFAIIYCTILHYLLLIGTILHYFILKKHSIILYVAWQDWRLYFHTAPFDIYFDVLTILCILIFAVELVLSSIVKPDYFGGCAY